MPLCKRDNKLCVEWLNEAHVGNRGIKCFTRLQRRREHAAESKDGNTLPLSANFSFANR